MFKKHALKVSVVKNDEAEDGFDAVTKEPVDYAKIAQIATDSTVQIVKVAGAAFAANKILTTVCEIAKIAAQAKLK